MQYSFIPRNNSLLVDVEYVFESIKNLLQMFTVGSADSNDIISDLFVKLYFYLKNNPIISTKKVCNFRKNRIETFINFIRINKTTHRKRIFVRIRE